MRLEIDQSDLDKFILIQLVSVGMQALAHDPPLKPRGEDRIEHEKLDRVFRLPLATPNAGGADGQNG